MTAIGADVLDGQKAIAEYLGVSVRSIERWARRDRDPLPLYRYLGSIQAKRAALDAWKERQRRHVSAHPVVSSRVESRRRLAPRQIRR